MIDEAHEAFAGFVTEASSGVVAFEALGMPEVVMVNGCLLFSMVLSLLESLHSFLGHVESLFVSIRKLARKTVG